jgi:hypothetical protein
MILAHLIHGSSVVYKQSLGFGNILFVKMWSEPFSKILQRTLCILNKTLTNDEPCVFQYHPETKHEICHGNFPNLQQNIKYINLKISLKMFMAAHLSSRTLAGQVDFVL